ACRCSAGTGCAAVTDSCSVKGWPATGRSLSRNCNVATGVPGDCNLALTSSSAERAPGAAAEVALPASLTDPSSLLPQAASTSSSAAENAPGILRTRAPEWPVALHPQQGWIIQRLQLFTQLAHMPLPETRFGEPRKRLRKCRIIPALRNPRRMVQHAHAPQRLDQHGLACIQVRELFITIEQQLPFTPHLVGRAGNEQPQILHGRTSQAVIEIHEQRTGGLPEDVARMAVTMQSQPAHLAHRVMTGGDRLHQFGGDFRV